MPSIRAAVMTAPQRPIEIREFPEPDLPPGSPLLRTTLSEVCGTDVHLWHGRLDDVPYPTRCSTRRVYGITDSADEGLFGGGS